MNKRVITYQELAERLDALKLFNKAAELDQQIYDGLENGSLMVQNDDGTESENYKDIFQWYLISPSDAEYIKNNTDELIFYSDVLDEYVWGVTHFGTSWDCVELEFGKDND
jgi:hypothetical protein